jgi:hypothetical protein
MANKLIDRTFPVDVGGVSVAVRVLSMREEMRLDAMWRRYLGEGRESVVLCDCIEAAVENFTADEVLETFTTREVYELIGAAFKEASLTGLERKKSQSSPDECTEKSVATAGEETAP